MQTSLLIEANSLAARRWAKQFHCCNIIRAASVATSSPPSHSQLQGRCYSIYRDCINFHLKTSNKKGITATSPILVTRNDKARNCRPIGFLSSASSSFSTSSSSPTSNDDHHGIHLSPTQTTLALSVHFKHPALGMKDFEILSRASAFLINVDPLSPENNRRVDTTVRNTQDRGNDVKDDPNNNSPSTIVPPNSNMNTNTNYPHLTQNQNLRQKLLHRQNYAYEPAGGPRRFPHQLNWLEFCPDAFRPKVHVVASSHVLSPWLWPKYYGQDWLRVLKDGGEGGAGGEGFVRYSLEVWGDAASGGGKDGNDGGGWIGHDGKLEGVYKPLAKFALNPYPIHHPQGMDVAVIHLKQEDTALKHLTSLGIHPLNLPTMHEFRSSTIPVFHPDERVLFQGYEVDEANMADEQELPSSAKSTTNQQKQHQNRSSSEEDERTFHPYSSLGNISMASPDRFLAKTKGGPLPEGLCGGPVIQLTHPKTGDDIPLTNTNTNTKTANIATVVIVIITIIVIVTTPSSRNCNSIAIPPPISFFHSPARRGHSRIATTMTMTMTTAMAAAAPTTTTFLSSQSILLLIGKIPSRIVIRREIHYCLHAIHTAFLFLRTRHCVRRPRSRHHSPPPRSKRGPTAPPPRSESSPSSPPESSASEPCTPFERCGKWTRIGRSTTSGSRSIAASRGWIWRGKKKRWTRRMPVNGEMFLRKIGIWRRISDRGRWPSIWGARGSNSLIGRRVEREATLAAATRRGRLRRWAWTGRGLVPLPI
mmetsp:Transcript_15019/g.31795  ORF Transcript_15019/g.31795 Transcript_15019/m.31795 type:complete len:760 (+) Transcript_15019:41-2320(+)